MMVTDNKVTVNIISLSLFVKKYIKEYNNKKKFILTLKSV